MTKDKEYLNEPILSKKDIDEANYQSVDHLINEVMEALTKTNHKDVLAVGSFTIPLVFICKKLLHKIEDLEDQLESLRKEVDLTILL